jgi:plasmid stability protein
MSTESRKATLYLDAELHRALRLKAAESERTMSDLVNEALRQSLLEDAEDLAAFDERAKEPSMPFEDMVKDLRKRGKL